jgi:hypothetical protein
MNAEARVNQAQCIVHSKYKPHSSLSCSALAPILASMAELVYLLHIYEGYVQRLPSICAKILSVDGGN